MGVTLNDVYNEVQLVRQAQSTSSLVAAELKEVLMSHIKQDEARFNQLQTAQTIVNTDIALLKQSGNRTGTLFNGAWKFVAGVVTAYLSTRFGLTIK